MTPKVDEKADALYLRLDDSKIIESEEVSPGVILDFNADNQVVGVEILHLSKRSPKLDALHEAGVLSAVAQALIGHDSEAMHELYISVGREALEKATAALPEI